MAQSSPSMISHLPRVDPPQPAGTTSPSARGDTYWLDPDPPTTIASSSDGGGQHLPHGSVVGGGLSGDAIALHTRARDQVAHSGPPRVTQDGPRPPVTGPGPSIATAPRSAAAVTPPRTSSPPLRGHAASPAPGPEMMAAVFEMLRSQERDRKLDRKRQEQQQELDRKRQEHDRERDRERDRLLIEIQRENSAGLKQLRRDMANSPRFSRRGTPTGTPVPAADDSPKHAPVKHPLRCILPSPPYQVADRHPGSAETTPPPHHVPVHTESSRTRTSTVDPPAPYTATRRGLVESFRPLGPPPHPPREVAPPRSSPPPVARITTHPTSQCRPPKPDPSPVTNNDQLQAIVAAFTTVLAQTQHTAAGQPAADSECTPAPRHEPHTLPVRYDPPPAHNECPEPVHAYSLGRVHDGRYSPYQQPPPHPPNQPMQPTVNDPPPESTHHRNQSAPQTSADPRDFLEDGPSISYDVLPATSLMRTRMDVRPFNPDSEAWNTWFAHFQEAASNNGWSPADRCQRLQALVQGKARLALTAIPREQRTYTECVERLRASYAPRKRPDEWIAELQNRRQAKVESFMQYRDALCTLALRVHGGDPNSASWLIAQFCDGLRNQDIGQRLAERDPPTLLAAVEEASRLKRIANRRRSRDRMAGHVCQSSSESDDSSPTRARRAWVDKRRHRPLGEGGRHLQGRPPRAAHQPSFTELKQNTASATPPAAPPAKSDSAKPLPPPPPRPTQPRSGQTPEPQLAELIRLFGRWLLSTGAPAMRSPPHTPTWTHHKSTLKPSPSKPTPDRPCYRCQQPGHWARECPVGRQPQRKVRLVTADNGDSSGPASDVEPPLGFAEGSPQSDCVYTDPDDDDVYNASHVALDCDGTPTSDVTVRSASAPREWFLPVTVGGVDTLMLVDTGAMRTCLASTVISPHIPPLELDTTKNIRLHSAGGDPLTVHGQWDCSLTVGDSDFPVRALVCDLGGPHGLLGADFLTSYGARLNWLEGTLYLKGKPFRLTGRRPPKTRGPGQVVLSVVGVSHGLDHEFTVRGDSAVLPPGSLTNVTLMQEPEPTSHLAVVKADGNITLSRPLVDVQGTTPMPCSLVADLSAPVPREAWQPDDPTDPTPDPVGDAPFDWRGDPTPSNSSAPIRVGGVLLPAHLAPIAQLSDLTGADLTALAHFILQWDEVFVRPDTPLGQTNRAVHVIDTRAALPIKVRARPIPMAKREACAQQLEDMLADGIVVPSTSPWSAPVVMAQKKDGTLRFCVDYRSLNEVTVKDCYPMPHIEDCLEALGGNTWYCSVDLASGFWQVALDPASQPMTAFATDRGLFEFRVMPYGLCNAPATFERLMDTLLRDLIGQGLVLYMDDVTVYGTTVSQVLERLDLLFARLASAGLTLKPKKCTLFSHQIEFLGHVISASGMHTQPDKIARVRDWPTPRTQKQVRSFLGLAAYYQRFVPDYASKAAPLYQLVGKGVPFKWTDERQQNFESLKHDLTTAPVLAFPHPTAPYILDTDASGDAMGAVLSQVVDGQERVVAYAAKVFHKTQRRYCTTLRELAAVVTFVKKFRKYLYGRKFTIRTDHASLVWLARFRDSDDMLARWLAYLYTYDWDIQHRPGIRHGNADAMSRFPLGTKIIGCDRGGCGDCGPPPLPPVAAKALAAPPDDTRAPTVQSCPQTVSMIDSLPPGAYAETITTAPPTEQNDRSIDFNQQLWLPPTHLEARAAPVAALHDHTGEWWLPAMSLADLKAAQRADPHVGRASTLLEADTRPTPEIMRDTTDETRSLLAQWPSVHLQDGVLVRELKVDTPHPHTRFQVVAPHGTRRQIFEALHASPQACHLGGTRTYNQITRHFYWPGCSSAIRRWCLECIPCARAKPGTGKGRAPLHQDSVSAPMERVAIDILGPLPETEDGNEYILVACDYFTKWVQVWPLPDHRAPTVARALMTDLFLPFGVPTQLHSDQGREFESRLISELCRAYEINKTRTTPYRPQSDGLVERFNRTILQMLRTFVGKDPRGWDTRIYFCAAAYRATVHDSTGCTPNLLMLGRDVTMPADIMFGAAQVMADRACTVSYVERVLKTHWAAHVFVRTHVGRAARRQKRSYDRALKPRSFNVGDSVMVLDVPNANKKLGVPWAGPYSVLERVNDLLYGVAMGTTGRRFVHVDMLKPAPPPASSSDDDAPQPGTAHPPNRDMPDEVSDSPPPNPPALLSRRPQRQRRIPGWRQLDLLS